MTNPQDNQKQPTAQGSDKPTPTEAPPVNEPKKDQPETATGGTCSTK